MFFRYLKMALLAIGFWVPFVGCGEQGAREVMYQAGGRNMTSSVAAVYLPAQIADQSFNSSVNANGVHVAIDMRYMYVAARRDGGLGQIVAWSEAGQAFNLRLPPDALNRPAMEAVLRPASAPATLVAIEGEDEQGNVGYIVIAVPTEALSGGQPAVRRTPKTPWIVAYADAHGVRVAYLDDQMLRQLGDIVSHTNLPQKLRSASE